MKPTQYMQQTPSVVINAHSGPTGTIPPVSFPIIVIGASTGGLDAIKSIVAKLPPHLGAAIFIVWHMSATVRGIVPEVLNKYNTIPASHARNGETIEPNHIYVAPPDYHLIIEGGRLRITKGPKENRFRPAVDPLFRSAAHQYGNKVIGVILSGALDDGTSGLWMVKHRGGTAIIQLPADAVVPSMPASAARYVEADFTVPAAEMPALLVMLVKEQLLTTKQKMMDTDKKTALEIRIAADENHSSSDVLTLGELSPFTCPECHGVLTSIIEGGFKRFRCHTGHAFTADSLLAALTADIEDNLWNAIRSLKESSILMNHIGDHFAELNKPNQAARFFSKAQDVDTRTRLLRDIVSQHQQVSEEKIIEECNGAKAETNM